MKGRGPPKRAPEGQRRACELLHEQNRSQLVEKLTPQEHLLFLETSDSLGRAWLQATPSSPALLLSDDEARYALCRTLLSSRSAEGCRQIICNRLSSGTCGLNDTPGHHLVCKATGRLRTTRHHSCVAILMNRLSKVTRDAKREQVVGACRGGRMDIVATLGDTLMNIDVGIATVRELPPNSLPLWTPTDDQVQEELAKLKESMRRGIYDESLFFW